VVKKKTKPVGVARPSWWQRSRGRLALAASLLLFVLGYWALASVFPQLPFSPHGVNKQHIAKDLPIPDVEPRDIVTPSGRPAQLYERRSKDGRIEIFLKGLPDAPQP
jgi:hypothetical protein